MTADEKSMRLTIFANSLKSIDEKNANSNNTKYGITMFADWTDTELKQVGYFCYLYIVRRLTAKY